MDQAQTVIGQINSIRTILSDQITDAKELEKVLQPPVVQEVVLYRRDLESARMRLGVARTYLQGGDPFRDGDAAQTSQEK